MGVVDEIIWEQAEAEEKQRETYLAFPVLKARIHSFLKRSLDHLNSMVSRRRGRKEEGGVEGRKEDERREGRKEGMEGGPEEGRSEGRMVEEVEISTN